MSADAIYHEAIKSLAAAAVAHGTLASPDGRAFLDNPLCGDCVEMQVNVSEGVVKAVAHDVKGCLLCRAAASAIGKHAVGAKGEELRRLTTAVSQMLKSEAMPPGLWDDVRVFAPVRGHPSRHRCVELPFQALVQALDAAAK